MPAQTTVGGTGQDTPSSEIDSAVTRTVNGTGHACVTRTVNGTGHDLGSDKTDTPYSLA